MPWRFHYFGRVLIRQQSGGASAYRNGRGHHSVRFQRSIYSSRRSVNDFQIGAWIGLVYAVVLVIVSVYQNRRLFTEQIGFTVGAVLACQNILPPFKFISFALTTDHVPLLPPLAGQEKYLLVAGVASEMVTLVTLYSLFVQALKRHT